jgi:Ca2+-transporting ATPase
MRRHGVLGRKSRGVDRILGEHSVLTSWHSMEPEEVMAKLGSVKQGLSSAEAAARLEKYGRNELKEIKKTSALSMFLAQFKSFFIYLLLFGALVSGLMGEWLDFSAIIAIVILNAAVGFIQNYRAEKAIENLKKSLVQKAHVIRDGKMHEVMAAEVVPGDILVLQEGDKIVGDARLFESDEIRANEAVLTGESAPLYKAIKAIKPAAILAERSCMVYSGTAIVGGSGRAVVVATGMSTEFGRIASIVQEVERDETPLQKKLDEFGRRVGLMTIVICVAIGVFGVLAGMGILEMFITSVSVAIAAVPEGLPAVITICLAIAVKRMHKVNSLIRRLPAAETLGMVTVICSDKTGTMTKEEMGVTDVCFGGKKYDAEGLAGKRSDTDFKWLMETGCLCNDAGFGISGGKRVMLGDPTEQALIKIGVKYGFDKDKLNETHPRIKGFPFSSERKMMSSVRRSGGKTISYVKGAPEILLKGCTSELVSGKVRRLDEKRRRDLTSIHEGFSQGGLRVLGFAYREMRSGEKITQKSAESGLIFIGFQGMLDSPRKEVMPAVRACMDAGISVKMITGDSALTAKAVASQIGLRGDILRGDEIAAMSDEELSSKIAGIAVFARTTPEQKMRIVEILKKKGEVVAVTGDGVNDVLALKRSDISIAMGIRGTDVARDVSDMILTDDNFASIVNAVGEGRRIFDNIKKFSYYLLSSNMAEIAIVVFCMMFGFMFGWPGILALIPVQLLWINLVTDGLTAIPLSVEGPEPNIMKRKPEKAGIVTRNVIIMWLLRSAFITVACILLVEEMGRADIVKMQTIIFTALVFFENFNALNFRSFSRPVVISKPNVWLYVMLAFSFAMQFAIIYLAPLQAIFGTTALMPEEFVDIFIYSFSLLVAGEVIKGYLMVRNRGKK